MGAPDKLNLEDKNKRFIKLTAFMKQLVMGNYYGKVTISFEAGHPVNLKREDNIKIEP